MDQTETAAEPTEHDHANLSPIALLEALITPIPLHQRPRRKRYRRPPRGRDRQRRLVFDGILATEIWVPRFSR